MIAEGIGIVGYDVSRIKEEEIKEAAAQANYHLQGGGRSIGIKENANRTLFLCYPDKVTTSLT
jgi:hypothetical protein